MKRLAFALLFAASALQSFAATATVDGITWTYTVSNGKATIGDGSSAAIPTSTTGAISIPATLGGYTVTSIGNDAFLRCFGLTSVTIPNTITSIGKESFYNCTKLDSISIPNTVTSIGSNAFFNCRGLSSITIPASVTSIGNVVFQLCTGLKSIVIENGVISIGWNAFEGCSGLTTITIPDSVTTIDDDAFHGCSNLAAIFIPESLASQTDSWGLPSGCRIVTGPDYIVVETIRVPKAWIVECASAALTAANDDWMAAANATAANGANKVWECYVAGLDPANTTNRFLAQLSFDGIGAPSVGWTPDLGAERVYAVEGRATLTNAWGAVGDDSRFFRVHVAMPGGFGDAVITFETAGGSAVAPITAAVGSALTTPAAPTKAGYAFAGWSPAFPATMPLGGATLTAQWTPNTYAVKFNANGGSGSMANQSFVYGTAQELAANAFTRTRYAFAGWATSATGAAVYANRQSVQNLTTVAGGLVNLYAVWEPAVDKVYWTSLAYSPAGREDLENVRPSSEQIKQLDAQNLTDETLAAGIRMVFDRPVINGTAYTFWIFVAFPQSWVSKIAWWAGLEVTPPEPVTREIDGVLYNTYIFGEAAYPYQSGPMDILLKKK